MAFTESFLSRFSQKVEIGDFNEIEKSLSEKIKSAVQKASNKSGNFNFEDCVLYTQGSYLNEVNVDDNAKFEFVLELKKSNDDNYAEMQYGAINLFKRRFVKIKPKYSLLDFKNELLNAFDDEFVDSDVFAGVNSIIIQSGADVPVNVEVTLAFSFTVKSQITGFDQDCILVYDQKLRKYIVSYPHLHSQNLNAKDEATGGNAKKLIRLFKNLRNLLIQENLLKYHISGYFVDCLVYNIPNEILIGNNFSKVVLDALNFLNNKNLNEFVCIHEQFKMFGNGNDQFEVAQGRVFINELVYAYNNFEW